MNHKELLLQVFSNSKNISDIKLPKELVEYLDIITSNLDRNKGVYTVLVTLLTHKLLEPKQDIRLFQKKFDNGFSARSVDTKLITPTLKELGLPSMAETGWLTRSLEQPYPYTLEYKGEISGAGMKKAFLSIIDIVQEKPKFVENVLRYILNSAILHKENNTVEIKKLDGAEEVLISNIVQILDKHFSEKYSTHGGSKLPVLAFYAIYQSLIGEIGRYKDCTLGELGSHTASDRTSKTAGDIQILKNGNVVEAIEVKLDKEIDITMTRIAYEKIVRFNPRRYYILSYIGINKDDENEIQDLILEIQEKHGCQLIVNGLLHTLKYYLRLIDNPAEFMNRYIELVEKDSELKAIHKNTLTTLINKYL